MKGASLALRERGHGPAVLLVNGTAPPLWASLPEPVDRLRRALTDIYRYHRATEAMITRALADSREDPVMRPYHAHWQRTAVTLLLPLARPG